MRAPLFLALLIGLTAHAAANQPRSRVSGVHADMRSLATAIESYYVDHSAYPPGSVREGQPLEIHWLTTPLAYLGGVDPAIDRFKVEIARRAANRWEAMLAEGGSDWLWPLWGSAVVFIVMTLAAIAGEERRRGPRVVAEAAGRGLIFAGLSLALLTGIVVGAKYSSASLGYLAPNTLWTEDWVVYSYHSTADRWILQSVGPDGVPDLDDLRTLPLEDREATQALLIPISYDPTNGYNSSGDIFRSTYGIHGW